jgi:hypothetical protein
MSTTEGQEAKAKHECGTHACPKRSYRQQLDVSSAEPPACIGEEENNKDDNGEGEVPWQHHPAARYEGVHQVKAGENADKLISNAKAFKICKRYVE